MPPRVWSDFYISCSKTLLRFLILPGKNNANISPTASSTTNAITSISDAGDELSTGDVSVGVVSGVDGVVDAGVCGSGVG